MKVTETKSIQGNSFRISPIAASIALALAAQFTANTVNANGGGYGPNTDISGATIDVQTYYANSPQGIRPAYDFVTHTLSAPVLDAAGNVVTPAVTLDTGTPLRKFVDSLGGAYNGLDANGLPVAIKEKWKNPITGVQTQDDYIEIGIVEYTQQMHTDLPKATRLRGYVQIETPAIAAGLKDVTGVIGSEHIQAKYLDGTPMLDTAGNQVYWVHQPHYLGPVILASKGVALRMKYTNFLPYKDANGVSVGSVNGQGGEMPIPTDEFIPGAGLALGANGKPLAYSQNRAVIHWHGGDTPWISDGTPHQWTAPAGEAAAWTAGIGQGPSFRNVPDMPDPGPGAGTLYFPNNLSGRLMFYHDHSYGLTRLNVYMGEAAGYVVTDPVELQLVADTLHTSLGAVNAAGLPVGLLDSVGIPLVIQDKTFVPKNIGPVGGTVTVNGVASVVTQSQDAKWDLNHWGQPGDLWFPHVYETNQDPNSIDGTNPTGRWDWGPWFWPVFPSQYSLPTGAYGDVTVTPESFMDTPLVNGVAYPTMTVEPKSYRFRILNAANDRTLNLGLYQAVDAAGKVCDASNTAPAMAPAAAGGAAPVACTEVHMVPATPTAGFPATWPTDGRPDGVPDPATAGPDIIQIGSEGGLLPAPVILKSQPISYDANKRSITIYNVLNRDLLLGGAERADVIIDFSKYAGQTLIVYNDAPTPMPALDPRTDYQTNDGDKTDAGGAYNTLPGYGPNIRTVMQIKVASNPPAVPVDTLALAKALPVAYAATQPAPIIPEVAYNAPFGRNDVNNYAGIFVGSAKQPMFQYNDGTKDPVTGKPVVKTLPIINKAIQELFDPVFGRMNATLAVELPFSSALIATTIPLAYIDPPVENLDSIKDGETQIWKITHNGVDSHPVHFHLVNVQLLNRVDWSGVIKPPQESELGWKETIVMSPLEDVYIAVRAARPATPFGLPTSSRPLDPSQALNSTAGFSLVDSTTGGAPTFQMQLDANGKTIKAPIISATGSYSNQLTDFDNEYVWHCHILGHEENDFMRPFVFHPTVIVPDMPGNLTVNGSKLSWTDPTPVYMLDINGNPIVDANGKQVSGVDAYGVATATASTIATNPANGAKYAVEASNNPKNEIGFKVLQSVDGVAPYLPVLLAGKPVTLPANATSWSDASVVAGNFYQVVAYNAAGDSVGSTATVAPVASAAPNAAVPTAPVVSAVISGLTQTKSGTNSVISWNAVAGATGYIVTAGGLTQTVNTTSATISGVANGTVTVVAITAAGNTAAASLFNGVAYKPVALVASQGTGAKGTITLTWANSPLNVNNVTGLSLTWGANKAGAGVGSASFVATATGATIIGLSADKDYTFTLTAVGPMGSSLPASIMGLSGK